MQLHAGAFSGERGQTLLLMAVAIFLMTLLLFATTRMGEHARRQFYLQSVADNTAYSATVLMARQLNLSAVLNRSLIGNQVAIAQWVGLASWLAMASQSVFNLSIATIWVPGLNKIMLTLSRLMNRIEHSFDSTIKALLGFHAAIIKAISIAQVSLEAAMVVETVASIQDFIDAHDKELDWQAFQGGSVVPFPALWYAKTDTKSSKKHRDSAFFKRLVMQSRDPFTSGRSYDWVSLKFIRVRKHGGNELETLSNGQWNWNAVDSVAVHLKEYAVGGKWVPVFGIGWGARAAYRKYYGSRRNRYAYDDAFYVNDYVTELGWNQLRSYRVAAPSFSYLSLRDNDKYGANALVLWLEDKQTGQVAYARSEVHFSRPLDIFSRGDNKAETANLYNALWEPRLLPLSAADKAAIVAKKAAAGG